MAETTPTGSCRKRVKGERTHKAIGREECTAVPEAKSRHELVLSVCAHILKFDFTEGENVADRVVEIFVVSSF